MKFEYQDGGAVSRLIITSTIFEHRRHVRAVDAALLYAPEVRAVTDGFFFMKTVISGPAVPMLRANRAARQGVTRG